MRSGIITTYVLLSAVVPVIWLLGIMPIVELGLDPLSILVPFLIFAIAVSHAVQMTNAWKLEMSHTNDSTLSAAKSFEKLFVRKYRLNCKCNWIHGNSFCRYYHCERNGICCDPRCFSYDYLE